MFTSFLPKSPAFFDYFEKHVDLLIELAKELENFTSLKLEQHHTSVTKVKDLEHAMDQITHQCIDAIHKSFITPIERGDIYELIKKMDSIANNVDGAVNRFELYELTVIRPEVKEFGTILLNCTLEMKKAILGLKTNDKNKDLVQACVRIHHLEQEGDVVFRKALSNLFKQEDAIAIIKWKELFERLEMAIDRSAQVAHIIEGAFIESN